MNRIMLVVYNYDLRTFAEQKISTPIDFLNEFSIVGTGSKAVVALNWDTFIFGFSDFVMVESQTFRFTKKIGYVMGLSKNRVNSIMSDTQGDDLLTIA